MSIFWDTSNSFQSFMTTFTYMNIINIISSSFISVYTFNVHVQHELSNKKSIFCIKITIQYTYLAFCCNCALLNLKVTNYWPLEGGTCPFSPSKPKFSYIVQSTLFKTRARRRQNGIINLGEQSSWNMKNCYV